ncbi:MAG: putative Ig domain-containing protein [Paludibacter sp.]|nr:putative Ig domain-containing protein [Paludibacter sp.]
MKNVLKMFGIIALVAVIGFSITSCGGGDDGGGNGNGNGNGSGNGNNSGTAPTITTASLPNGTVGTAYSQTLAATGDTPITWTLESGALPTGLSLATTGVISGTPTTAATSTFTVKATNAKGNNTKSLSITITGGSSGGGGNPASWTVVANSTFGSETNGRSDIKGIAYGNGKFVAVGYGSGKIAYSSDGINWTAATNSGYDLSKVVWGKDKFVAVGSSGKMVYSSNGETWTAVTNSTFTSGDTINAIAWGNNTFVAGGSGGKMAYSSDGITWQAVTNSTFDDSIRDIKWGNDRFVAMARVDKTAYSMNGTSWTAGGTFGGTRMAWGSNKFVVPNGTSTGIGYSSDSVAWTQVSVSGVSMYSITYGNGRFVICGGDKMAFSTDGIVWTVVEYTIQNRGSNLFNGDIVWGNNKFVAVGQNGLIAYSGN